MCEFCGSGPDCGQCGRTQGEEQPTLPAAIAGAAAASGARGVVRGLEPHLPLTAGKWEELRAAVHQAIFEVLNGTPIDSRKPAA